MVIRNTIILSFSLLLCLYLKLNYIHLLCYIKKTINFRSSTTIINIHCYIQKIQHTVQITLAMMAYDANLHHKVHYHRLRTTLKLNVVKQIRPNQMHYVKRIKCLYLQQQKCRFYKQLNNNQTRCINSVHGYNANNNYINNKYNHKNVKQMSNLTSVVQDKQLIKQIICTPQFHIQQVQLMTCIVPQKK